MAVKAAHFARPPGLGLDGREHGDNIRVRRGSEYSIRTLQNADEKHGASTDLFNRCTWYLIPSLIILGVTRRLGETFSFGNTAAAVLESSDTTILFVAS